MPKLVILSVVSGMILFRREAFSTKEARYFEKNEKVYINKLIYYLIYEIPLVKTPESFDRGGDLTTQMSTVW